MHINVQGEFFPSDSTFALQPGENPIELNYLPVDAGNDTVTVQIVLEMSLSGGVINGPLSVVCIGHGPPVPDVITCYELQEYDPETGFPVSPYQNEIITVEGVVFVAPGTYSESGGGYLQDDTGGINFHTFDLPVSINEGDRIRLTGPLWSSSWELYIGDYSWITLETDVDSILVVYTVTELLSDYRHVGSFVQITATATGVTPESFFLDDGMEQVEVFRTDYTGVSFMEVTEGSTCTVVSPCMNLYGTIKLSPRRQSDLIVVPPIGFTDVTALYPGLDDQTAGISMAWIDYDLDGDSDLYILAGSNGTNRFFKNQRIETGLAGFTELNDPLLNHTGYHRSQTWGVFQNDDGYPDLYMGVHNGENVMVENQGIQFTDQTIGLLGGDPSAQTRGVRMVDYDNDGLLDIYEQIVDGQSRLLKNMGNYWFEDHTTGDLGTGNGVYESAWSDVDRDGDMDVYILRDNLENLLLINDGQGEFTLQPNSLLADSGRGQGGSWGDYNNDGQLDLFVANFEGVNRLFRNDGDFNFTEVTPSGLSPALSTQSGVWGDYDNDGDLDLFVTYMTGPNQLWRNDGNDQFTNMAEGALADEGPSIAAGWSDFDLDGDLDLFVGNHGANNLLLENNLANGNHWLGVKLVGTRSNTSAIGARVLLITNNGTQYRELGSNHAFWSQPNLDLHFGLADQQSVNKIEVRWPSGQTSIHMVADVDETITLTEPNDWTDIATGTPLASVFTGSAIAWGDFDSDGDDDAYVVGVGINSLNALFVNDGEGGFIECTPTLLADPGAGMDATWGDFDNDGDLDLFLANYDSENRLFENLGSGSGCWNFADVVDAEINNTGSTVAAVWVDYDHNGSLDLYVSNNDSNNQLLLQTESGWQEAGISDITNLGPSQGCAWVDFDMDFDEDLFLSFEGEVDILFEQISPTEFHPIIMPSDLSGQGCSWADYDNDGDMDIYTTAWGPGNTLWRNDGDGLFTPVVSLLLENYRNGQAGVWGDYDNDGFVDLYLANYNSTNRLFRNEGGTGGFTLVQNNLLQDDSNSIGAAWSDIEGDGDLDIYVNNYDGDNRLYRNELDNGNSWLEVRLEVYAPGSQSNGAAIGALIRVDADDLVMWRRVSGGSGYSSQSSLTQHFGLGYATMVDRVTVFWPFDFYNGAHNITVFENILPGQIFTVDEHVSGTDNLESPLAFRLRPCYPNPFNPMTTISYDLPQESRVDLAIYDVTGRLVTRLRSGEVESAGLHDVVWRGQDHRGRIVASGVYLYRLQAGGNSETRRMVLMK